MNESIRVGHYELLADDTGGRGRVLVVDTDEDRAWSYCWPAKTRGSKNGETVAEWVAACDLGYVAGKFGAGHWFDAESTVASVRGWIVEQRRAGDLDRDDAREMWESLDDVKVDGEEGWSHWLGSSDANDIPDAWEHTRYGVDPMFRRAFEALWPELRARATAARDARARAVAVDLPPLSVDQLVCGQDITIADQLHAFVDQAIIDGPVFRPDRDAVYAPPAVIEYLRSRPVLEQPAVTIADFFLQPPRPEIPPGVMVSRKLLLQLRDWVPEVPGYRAVLAEIDAALGGTPDGREER